MNKSFSLILASTLALALTFILGCSEKCGEAKYDPEKQFCAENAVYEKCGGSEYDPADKICVDGKATAKCGDNGYEPETHFCDVRDSKIYKYAKIGEHAWMAENLNYAGESKDIGNCETNDICESLGRLYLWKEANIVCPNGWHLPSKNDWLALINYAGESVAGAKLKAKQGWNGNGNGTDDFGFSALAGGEGRGYRDRGGIYYSNAGKTGNWWSSNSGYFFLMTFENGYPYSKYDVNRVHNDNVSGSNHYSVRCIRDYSCNGKKFDASKQFCANNDVHDKCGDAEYNPATQFCYNNASTNTMEVIEKCGGKEYNYDTHFCVNNKIDDKSKYPLCEDQPYNPKTHFCYCTTPCWIEELCGGESYAPCQYCDNGKVKDVEGECNPNETDFDN